MASEIHSHRDLIVWQKAMDLVMHVYEFTSGFPEDERFGLVSQMRRAAVSIPSNIAEGRKRGTRNDFRQFLLIAYGSGAELETQWEIARRLNFGDADHAKRTGSLLSEIMRMLNAMLRNLHSSKSLKTNKLRS